MKFFMFTWLMNLLRVKEAHGDLSKHRVHAHLYEDMCQ